MAGPREESLGGFRILEQIDEESGQGRVFKAICETGNPGVAAGKGQIVALKVMPVRDSGRQQWRRLESRTNELARIDHPNVVRYLGCFEERDSFNDYYVVVQEFLEGETLKNRLKRFPNGLDADEGLKIAASAIEGLAYTASKGIIHRDIKPGNIFICQNAANGGNEPSVKLIDFEIATQGDGSSTASTANLRGSFNYMAPEFLQGDEGQVFKGDIQSDIFSMGVTLHEILSGRLPYDSAKGKEGGTFFDFVARWKDVSGDGGCASPVSICRNIGKLLENTEELFDRCLSRKRKERFRGFGEFRASLEKVRSRVLESPSSGNSYRLLQFVGSGGFGEVFKASESSTGRIVAVKHLRDAKYADRFKREAKILSQLGEDCFVRFVESFSQGAEEFLVMDFLYGMPGNSLWDAIKRSKGGGLPKKDVFTAFMRYAHGLRMLHAKGVFHRDIKPSNLYFPVGRPELAVIMDLGVARDMKGTMTVGCDCVPGTPDYMPPEVVNFEAAGGNGNSSRGESGMDIYALGLCLYEALTAKTAFPRLPPGAKGYWKLVGRVRAKELPHFDDRLIDSDLLDLLSGMTAFNLKDRIKDALDVERRLGKLLEKIDRPVYRKRKSFKKLTLWLAWFAAAGAFVCGVLLFALPAAKKFYAEKRLANVLDSYVKSDPGAEDKENAWIVEFNPQSNGWLRIDEAAYAKCASAIEEVKRKISAERIRKDWLDRIDRCILPDKRLAVDVFEELNEQILPSSLGGDDLIKSKMRALGHSVWKELDACLSGNCNDIKERRARLETAKKIFANRWTDRVLDADQKDRMRRKIEAVESKCVIVPIKFSIPRLANGQRFLFQGREYAGGETIKLKPGRYSGEYVRNEVSPAGGPMYKSFPVEFSVSADAKVKIPDPGDWEYSDGYKAFLASPVDVHVPLFEDGTRCRIDGAVVASGKTLVAPGNHICVYEKDDWASQTNYFEALPGKSLILPASLDWKPGKDLERLRTAIGLSERGSWAEAEKTISGINIAAPENVKELDRLKAAVLAWNKAEAERLEREREAAAKQRAAEKKEFKEKFAKLLEIEPVAGRRRRLAAAKELLSREAAREVLVKSEFDDSSDALAAAERLVAGVVRNGGDFDFSVNGFLVKPGEARVVEYNDGLSQDAVVKASGYEDIKIGKELDESEIVILTSQWTMSDVAVRLEPMAEGVECLFNGERVNGEFKVKPGSYRLVFRRNGYEPQTVGFDAKISVGCTVEAPRRWNPLPVEIPLPGLEEGVRCYLGSSAVSGAVRLIPGETYEFRYQKDDCKDQIVKVFVDAATVAIPAPSYWTDTVDVVKLSEAERLLAGGKLDEAARSLDGVGFKTSANKKRLQELKDKIKTAETELKEKLAKEAEMKRFLGIAELAYTPEDLMGGSARECIQGYYGAVVNGYVLATDDRERIKHCYNVGMSDLKDQRKSVDGQIRSGVRPFRNPNDIDHDIQQLNEWYNALRK